MLTIDKGFEVFSPYTSKCAKCVLFELSEFSCKAFPEGIPDYFLNGEQIHDKIEKGQVGQSVLTLATD